MIFNFQEIADDVLKTHPAGDTKEEEEKYDDVKAIMEKKSARDGNLWVVIVIVKSWVILLSWRWLAGLKSKQPTRGQVSKLTQLLTMTTTNKFPLLDLAWQGYKNM